MNYLIQYKKRFWVVQIIFNIFSFYKQPQVDNTSKLTGKLIDITLKVWISFLFVLATTGILKLIFEFITNPSQFSNTSYGIFDYI